MVLLSSQVRSRFPGLNQVTSVGELVEKLKVLGPDIANLLHLAEKRQKVSNMFSVPCCHGLLQDLKSRRCSEELASARATLMRSSKMLMTSTKVRHGNQVLSKILSF